MPLAISALRTQIAFFFVCLCCAALAQQQTAPPPEPSHIVNSVVFMSTGEKIGLNLGGVAEGTALSIEEHDSKTANLVLSLKKEKKLTLFTIQNKTKYWLTYEAGIKTPQRDGLYKTSVMPVGPGLTNFESWPGAIDQLALKNFRISEKPGADHK